MTYRHTQSLDRMPDAVFNADPFAEARADVTPSAPVPVGPCYHCRGNDDRMYGAPDRAITVAGVGSVPAHDGCCMEVSNGNYLT